MLNREDETFFRLWERAEAGSLVDLEGIFLYFDSYIKNLSRINGRPDEDIAQEIRLEFYKALVKRMHL